MKRPLMGFIFFLIFPTLGASALQAQATGIVAQAIVVGENYAYVGFDNQLKIIDVSDKQNPVEIGQLAIAEEIVEIELNGVYLYLTSFSGLRIIDITQPITPIQISFFAETDSQQIELVEQYVYLTAQTYLVILDVQDPFHIIEVGRYQTAKLNSYWFRDLDFNNYRLFIVGGALPARTWVIDVSSPTTPIEITVWTNIRGPQIAIYSNVLYNVGSGCSTICLASISTNDISDLYSPVFITHLEVLSESVWVFELTDLYGYMGSQTGLYIFKTANPSSLELLEHPYQGSVYDLVVEDDYIFLATAYDGLVIMASPSVFQSFMPVLTNP